jgi:DNA invertase Pin-like site-specific DNA recombinase
MSEKAPPNKPLVAEKKIQARHQERLAIVYIRQSTVHQVQRHQESTQVQYNLVEQAERFGWPRERVLVIDNDLGLSGASAEKREGFQRLLGEVALDHVGAIFGVEMSRLARSCKDWYQLLELCALFGTLICDLDGVYDPSCYNDRLLLGLKGTMSEAELHVLKQRMWQGSLNKARRGELVSRVPIGYIRNEAGQISMNPDEQVQSSVRLVFDLYERLGTVTGVLRHFVRNGIQLPFRVHTGPNKGRMEWRRPSQSTIKNMLAHPIYAGAYVYGRSCQNPMTRQRRRRSCRLPREEWLVLLRDRVPSYLSWQQFEENQVRLAENRSRYESRGSVRRGRALAAGLVVCGRCGHRMGTQYCGPASQPRYFCAANQVVYGEPRCQSLAARALDEEVVRLTLKALTPAALEVSIQVARDIHKQQAEADTHWRQRLERAAYEAERAARQYHAVEPENRLVARTLESAWEEKLRMHRELQEEYQRFLCEQPKVLTAAEHEQIRRLATDVPSLWHAAATTDVDRKEILREVIDRVVVNVEGESEWVEAKVYWAGGHQTYIRFRRPVARVDQLSTWPVLRRRLREMVEEGLAVPTIAERLDGEGFRAPNGNRIGIPTVQTLLLRCQLSERLRGPVTDAIKLRPNEWLAAELAANLNVGYQTVYGWIRKNRIPARRLADGRWAVTADTAKCTELTAFQAHQQQRRQQHIASSKGVDL